MLTFPKPENRRSDSPSYDARDHGFQGCNTTTLGGQAAAGSVDYVHHSVKIKAVYKKVCEIRQRGA